MRSKTTKKPFKTILMVAVAGLALTILAGCGIGRGPFRHAYYGGPHDRVGYADQGAPSAPSAFDAETRGYNTYGPAAGYGNRRGGYCGW